MLRLFTTLYPEPDPARRAEYLECLSRNLAHPLIDEVCLLMEGDALPPEASPKLRLRPISSRPLYDDFFEWINGVAAHDNLSVIANTDIHFDSSLLGAKLYQSPNECYALSRWNRETDGSSRLFDRNDSQDAWIFRGRIRPELFGAFPLGVPRCDNRLLHELMVAGYTIKNPAFSIHIHHIHAGERPEYGDGDFLEPPYHYLFPHNLLSWPRTRIHNLRHPDYRIGWRFDRRKAWRSVRRVGRCLLCVDRWKSRARGRPSVTRDP